MAVWNFATKMSLYVYFIYIYIHSVTVVITYTYNNRNRVRAATHATLMAHATRGPTSSDAETTLGIIGVASDQIVMDYHLNALDK